MYSACMQYISISVFVCGVVPDSYIILAKGTFIIINFLHLVPTNSQTPEHERETDRQTEHNIYTDM